MLIVEKCKYISKNSIAASKRCLEEKELSSPSTPLHRKRNETFKILCILCRQAADEASEMRKKEK